ncbi:alanine racemase [Oerskovia jenensis]|uniref:D-serine deaminase-like pyridoxal phosphate-dependent protein n=1 Tax=Oerskovia jenensis TaxID=162169 RepID=A0ABS2LIU5_9CELL|nr:alanine racemase [Oerskovia jenensis]MBM7480312.1 D-serine deaminase-like pyridoxal phosphate-dependent protein [Oerskovia jenensis]
MTHPTQPDHPTSPSGRAAVPGDLGLVVGPATKGLRLDADRTVADVLADSPRLTDDAFSWPLLTLDDAALDHNVALMARLCAERGVEHAPHVKTAMSRSLYARQARAGAWGATVANPSQLRVVRTWGVERVFLANELMDPRDIAWLRRELEASVVPGGTPFEAWVYVDSIEGVGLLTRGFAGATPEVVAGLGVLVEVGVPGGRTGVRSTADALGLARAVRAAGLRVPGVAGYEGSAAGGTTPEDLAQVTAYCRGLRDVAAAFVREGLVPDDEPVVVTAGGSSFLDVVLAELPGPLTVAGTAGTDGPDGAALTRDVRVVVRSGAYVTHDHGFCARMDPWDRIPGGEPMHAAAVVWGQVLSVPEPGLVLCGVGRRDVSYDIDLPTALWLRTLDENGTLRPAHDLAGARVTGLNDQHLYLTIDPTPAGSAPVTTRIRPGDVVGFGISHPCTLFDKWRVAAVVSDDDQVVDIVGTEF